ncbi:MAG: hypothetical protein NTY09_10110 [bacterium]|nr:hypothetical protein [bacterium]
MVDWTEFMTKEARENRGEFSQALMKGIASDCLTRKPRDPEKRKLVRQLGLPDRYVEVQHPSPGNTPEDLYDKDI